jgi:hypothetical protein
VAGEADLTSLLTDPVVVLRNGPMRAVPPDASQIKKASKTGGGVELREDGYIERRTANKGLTGFCGQRTTVISSDLKEILFFFVLYRRGRLDM